MCCTKRQVPLVRLPVRVIDLPRTGSTLHHTPTARMHPVPYKPRSHKPNGHQTEQERKAMFDRRRGTAAQRGYDADWRRVRGVVVREEPLCRHCLSKGYTTPTSEVDHIIPHRGNDRLRLDRSNLQGLCKSCHSRKTATEDSGFAKRPTTSSSAHLSTLALDKGMGGKIPTPPSP